MKKDMWITATAALKPGDVIQEVGAPGQGILVSRETPRDIELSRQAVDSIWVAPVIATLTQQFWDGGGDLSTLAITVRNDITSLGYTVTLRGKAKA